MTAPGRLLSLLAERWRAGRPLRVAVLGAGVFGTMLLHQLRRLDGVEVAAVADLESRRAREALDRAGFPPGSVAISTDAAEAIGERGVEVVVEATGAPLAGVAHALQAIALGRHVVMVTVEGDALAGPALAARARAAGVVYSLAYGDQPALVCELVDWARACGLDVVCAGKGTKHLPSYHRTTPETVWDAYGLSARQVAEGGFNAKMFTSFIDGTKSAIEMAAVCNAAGLEPQEEGLRFPPAGTDRLAQVCIPETDGGELSRSGTVEVVSSLERDGSEVRNDLRWGVYVTFAGTGRHIPQWLRAYGLAVDRSGRFAAMYRPYHLIGLEASISVLSAGLLGEATGTPDGWRADVVAVAKRDLVPGDVLDGEGGETVYGALVPWSRARRESLLPVGLAHGVRLRRPVDAGCLVSTADVEDAPRSEALDLRAEGAPD